MPVENVRMKKHRQYGISLSDEKVRYTEYAYDFPISVQHMPHNRATCAVRKGKSNRQ